MVTWRPSLAYQGLTAIFSALMVFTLLSSLQGFWKMNASDSALFLVAGAAVGFAWLTWRFPWAGLFLAAAGVIGVVAATYYLPALAVYLRLLGAEGIAFWGKIRLFELDTTFGPRLGEFFLGSIGLLLSLLVVLETLTEGNTFWSIATGALIFGTEWLWYYDKSASSFMFYVVVGFALWVLGKAAQRDAKWAEAGRRIGYRSHVTTPIAWVLVASVLAAILPSEIDPLDLGKIGQKLQESFPFFRALRGGGGSGGGGRFSLRATGFAPNLEVLGGPVSLDNSVALQLMTDEPVKGTAYLRGATFTTYTGNAWVNGDPQYLQVSKENEIPTSYTSDVLREYVRFKVSPVINLGNTIFNQLEPMRVDDLKNAYRVDTDGNLWSERAIPRGATYQVSARLPRYSAEQIRLLSTAGPGDGYQVYRQIPATLPRRVGETARSVAAGQTHSYDKAVAIEAYLRGLKYDLNVAAPPSGRDFIDFFLFDLQRGYCVYSASALAVMLRELEIPTRFVEGFAVPASTDFSRNAEGKYLYPVRNSQAHAWVEAYFSGYGWVTFDPTPRADLPTIDRSVPAPLASPATSGSDGRETPEELNPDAGGPNRGGPGDLEGGDAGAGNLPREWPWALTALLALGSLLVLGYRRLQAQDRITASEGRQVVQEAWDRTDTLMTRFDFGRRPGQTAREYARTLGDDWPSLREASSQVALDYTRARYAPPEQRVDPEAPSRALGLWSQVHQELLSRYGWRLYLWLRLRWRTQR